MKIGKIIIWILAVLITVSSSIYQRKTGPTYPVKMQLQTQEGKRSFHLPRSGTTGSSTRIELPCQKKLSTGNVSGASQMQENQAYLYYKTYPVIENETYRVKPMERQNNQWVGFLPSLPAAGKWMYYVEAEGQHYGTPEQAWVIRYKGSVPAWVLIPHILFMFAVILLMMVAAGFALFGWESYRKYLYMSLISLFLGGFVAGPLVQHFAFGPYWTGLPIGVDITDNKTLIALLFMMLAWGFEIFAKSKPYKRWLTVLAAVVILGVFTIPHSMGGSERNPLSGKMESSHVFKK